MKSQIFSLVLLASIFSVALSQNDWVNLAQLPQLNVYAKNYTANIFSGYLNAGNGASHHYVFLESQNNPKTDPLVLWLNGGPGCSSLLGWLYEHGPFVFPDGETTFQYNNYSWNKIANVLYMESPACVGFSTCPNPNQVFDDNSVAQANLNALINFFVKYTNFTKNDFYVAGESYGGIYVPYLSYYIDQYNKKAFNIIKFKGFMVGNGVTNYKYDTVASMPDYFSFHAIISPSQRDQILYKTCLNPYSDECDDFLFSSKWTNNLNHYDLLRWCYNQTETLEDPNAPVKGSRDYLRFIKLGFEQSQEASNSRIPGHTGVVAPCLDGSGAYAWLNLPQVRQGLHISSSINYNWTMCSDINYNINMTYGSYWIYQQLVPQNKYKILVYSGDTDASVSILGTQKWIKLLTQSLNIATEVPKQIWTLPGLAANETQTAGWVTYYQGLEFVQVKGVGHMVPQWERAGAYKMFQYYLQNKILN